MAASVDVIIVIVLFVILDSRLVEMSFLFVFMDRELAVFLARFRYL